MRDIKGGMLFSDTAPPVTCMQMIFSCSATTGDCHQLVTLNYSWSSSSFHQTINGSLNVGMLDIICDLGPLVTLSAGQWKIKISIRFLFLFLTPFLFLFFHLFFLLFNTLIWTSRHWDSPVFKHFAEVILPPRPSCHLNWIWTKGLWNHPPVSTWSFTFLSHFYAKKDFSCSASPVWMWTTLVWPSH